ncbi:MAG: transposase, partial [Acidobacteriia bacterium]|nr:transposase [Terriglobia bacterium]MBZ5596294.1 transposase [Terriglobia bacterium]
MKKNRVFSAKFKAEAVRRMQSGESPSALARSLRLRRKLLYEWRNAVLAGR